MNRNLFIDPLKHSLLHRLREGRVPLKQQSLSTFLREFPVT